MAGVGVVLWIPDVAFTYNVISSFSSVILTQESLSSEGTNPGLQISHSVSPSIVEHRLQEEAKDDGMASH